MRQKAKKVTEKQRIFCHEYVIDFNGARAYKVAYPSVKDGTARSNAYKLLTNAYIQDYIKVIQTNLAELAGVSALRNILELKKIAYSSMAEFKEDWLTFKEFEELTDEQKSCIESIETRTETAVIKGVEIKKVFVKIKLYPKIPAIDSMNKMLGWNQPSKVDVTSNGEEIRTSPTIVFTTFKNENTDSEEV